MVCRLSNNQRWERLIEIALVNYSIVVLTALLLHNNIKKCKSNMPWGILERVIRLKGQIQHYCNVCLNLITAWSRMLWKGGISMKSSTFWLISIPSHPKEHINSLTERLFYFFSFGLDIVEKKLKKPFFFYCVDTWFWMETAIMKLKLYRFQLFRYLQRDLLLEVNFSFNIIELLRKKKMKLYLLS